MSTSIPPNSRFYGSKLKIERAKKHISDLKMAIEEFAKLNPYVTRVESHENPDLCNLVLRVKEPFPPCIVLMLGDAVHNLRSALDLLACDLVRPFTNGSTKGVYFPFGDDPNDFEGRIKQRKIDRASPKIIDEMRSLKAYPGGNDPLCNLHKLDITDKHVSMLQTGTVGALPNIIGGGMAFVGNRISPIDDGAFFVSGIPFGPTTPHVNHEKNMAFDVEFANGLPFQGESVVPTLLQVTKLVEGIVAKFEAIP